MPWQPTTGNTHIRIKIKRTCDVEHANIARTITLVDTNYTIVLKPWQLP